MSDFINIKDQLLPENELVIAISCFDENQKHGDWVCIGQVDAAFKDLPDHLYRTNIITTSGVGVHSIKWWHPIPTLPWKEGDEWFADDDWLSIKDSCPPYRKGNPFEFILFDEIDGIAECEYWNGYQSDTWSCKNYFNKPLFWRPFPILPVKCFAVLQC